MTKIFEVFISFDTYRVKVESYNKYRYAGWQKVYGYKKKWDKILGLIIHSNPHSDYVYEKKRAFPKTAAGTVDTSKKHLTIISIRKRLITDEDNLRAGTKPIPDCLTRMGWLYDDADQYTKIDVKELKVSESTQQQEGTYLLLENYEI